MFSFPLIVAQAQGFNQAEGLSVEIIAVATSVAIQSLVSGDLDFISTYSSATRAAVSGLPVRLVAAHFGNDQSLVVRPEIRRMDDLRGRTLGVSSYKSLPDVYLRMILKKNALIPDVDVKVLAIGGGTPLRLTALQTGRIDGTMMSNPHNKMAVKMGHREIFYMRELLGDRPTSGLATTSRKVQGDPDTVLRTVRAAARAIAFIKGHKQPTLQLMAKELGIQDKEIAELVYDDSVKLYSDTGIASDSAMHEEIAVGKETQGLNREIRISDVADWSFARAAYQTVKTQSK